MIGCRLGVRLAPQNFVIERLLIFQGRGRGTPLERRAFDGCLITETNARQPLPDDELKIVMREADKEDEVAA